MDAVRPRTAWISATLNALLLLAACSGDDPNWVDPSARTAGFQGVPVPLIAALKRQSDRGETYEVNRPVHSIVEWYDAVLVRGANLGAWQWCTRDSSIAEGRRGPIGYLYASADRRQILTVVVLADSRLEGSTRIYLDNRTLVGIDVSDQLSEVRCDNFTIESRMDHF